MKAKKYLETLIVLRIKWTGMVKIKHKEPYRCCSSYAMSNLIVSNGLDNLWRRENSDSLRLLATICPLARMQGRKGLYSYNNC